MGKKVLKGFFESNLSRATCFRGSVLEIPDPKIRPLAKELKHVTRFVTDRAIIIE